MLPCAWFSNRSQKASKCGKNTSDTLSYASCDTFFFLPHFDVICDLLLNRRTATWNLFVKFYRWTFSRPNLYLYMYTSSDSLFYNLKMISELSKRFLSFFIVFYLKCVSKKLLIRTFNLIGLLNCPITNCPIAQTVRLQLDKWIRRE